jgi:hypothetical protein
VTDTAGQIEVSGEAFVPMCMKAHGGGPPHACWAFNRLIHALDRATPPCRSLRLVNSVATVPLRTTLVAEHCEGSERDGHLNHDRAQRKQPDFSPGLHIHESRNARRRRWFHGSRIRRALATRKPGVPTTSITNAR